MTPLMTRYALEFLEQQKDREKPLDQPNSFHPDELRFSYRLSKTFGPFTCT